MCGTQSYAAKKEKLFSSPDITHFPQLKNARRGGDGEAQSVYHNVNFDWERHCCLQSIFEGACYLPMADMQLCPCPTLFRAV